MLFIRFISTGYVTHIHTRETKVILVHVFEVPTLQSGRYQGELSVEQYAFFTITYYYYYCHYELMSTNTLLRTGRND